MSQIPLSTMITIIIQLTFIVALGFAFVLFVIHAIYQHRKKQETLIPYVIVIMIAILIFILTYTLGWT